SDLPLVGNSLRKSSGQSINQIDDAMRGVQESYGQANIGAAGAGLRDNITKTATETLPSKVSAKYDIVDKLVDNTVKTDLPNTIRLANKISSEAAASGLPKSKAVDFIEEAVTREGLSYSGIKGLRTRVGEMMKKPDLNSSSISQGELKRIYGSLSDDLAKSVEAAGGTKALSAFNAANKYAARVASKRDQLNKIVNVQKDESLIFKMRDLASSGRSAGVKQLAKARSAVDPQTWDDVSASVLKDMGRDVKTGDFSPARFLTEWGKMSSQGKRILFGSTQKRELISNLDDIAIISKRFDSMKEFANPSGSGAMIATAAAAPFVYLEPVALTTALTGGAIMSKVMAQPAKVKFVSQYSKAKLLYALNPTPSAKSLLRNRSAVLATMLSKESDGALNAVRLAEELSGGSDNAIAGQQ
ncbi:MAG: hypothetical protein WBD01_14890, partial [Salaquimonas sp.]